VPSQILTSIIRPALWEVFAVLTTNTERLLDNAQSLVRALNGEALTLCLGAIAPSLNRYFANQNGPLFQSTRKT
jgi:hypothetical protein